MVELKEKVLISISSTPSLLVCPLLFSVTLASTLCVVIVVVVVVVTMVVAFVTVVGSSPPFAVGGIRDFSQAEIGFAPRHLLGNSQDVRDQFFGNVDPSFSWVVQYFFHLESASHEFHPVKPNDCGLSPSASRSTTEPI
jgi:hypothetical protein